MTLQDERGTVRDEPAQPAELDASERALLEAFLRNSGSAPSSNRIPFAFVAGVAMSGLLATTGTVIAVPVESAEIRYAGERTGTKAVHTQPDLPWVPQPVTRTAARDSSLTRPLVALTGRDITKLYELSGLTYKQLSKIFGVSERTIHLWAAGTTKPAARHLERLAAVLDAVTALDAGDASSRRALLLNERQGRPSLYNTWLRELAAGQSVGEVDTLHEPARHA